MACQGTKSGIRKSLIVFVLVLALSSTLVYAQIFDKFASRLENIPSFVQQYDKAISFVLLFFLFFLLFGTALKNTMPKEMSRQAWSIAFIMAMIAALGIISGTDFTITRFSTVFLLILFLNFVYLLFAIFSKFGMNKWIAFFLALAIGVVVALLMAGIVSDEKVSDVFKGNIFTAKAKPGEVKTLEESVKAIEEYNAKNPELESRIGLLGAQETVKKAEITLKEAQWNPALGDINNDPEYKKLKEELSKIQGDKRKAEAEQKILKAKYDKAVEFLKGMCIKVAVPESSVKREARQFISENVPNNWVDSNKKRYTDIAKACTEIERLAKDKKLALDANELKNVKTNINVSNDGVAYYTAIATATTREQKIEAYLGFIASSIESNEEPSVFVKEAAAALADLLEDEPELQLKLAQNYVAIAKNLKGKDDTKSKELSKQFAQNAADQLEKVREAYKFEQDENRIYVSKDKDKWAEATKLLIEVKKLQGTDEKELEAELRRFTSPVDADTLKIYEQLTGKARSSIKDRSGLIVSIGQSGRFIAEGEGIKDRKVEWKSSEKDEKENDKNVIDVSADGSFKVIKLGKEKVNLHIDDGVQQEWEVTVTAKEVKPEDKKEEEPSGNVSWWIGALLLAVALIFGGIKGYSRYKGRRGEHGEEHKEEAEAPEEKEREEKKEFNARRYLKEIADHKDETGKKINSLMEMKMKILHDTDSFNKYIEEASKHDRAAYFMDTDSPEYKKIDLEKDEIKKLVQIESAMSGLLQKLWEYEHTLKEKFEEVEQMLLDRNVEESKVEMLKNNVQKSYDDLRDTIHGIISSTSFGQKIELDIEKLLDKKYVEQRIKEAWLTMTREDIGRVKSTFATIQSPLFKKLQHLIVEEQKAIGQAMPRLESGDLRAIPQRDKEGPPQHIPAWKPDAGLPKGSALMEEVMEKTTKQKEPQAPSEEMVKQALETLKGLGPKMDAAGKGFGDAIKKERKKKK